MRPRDRALAARLTANLRSYEREVRPLPGIQDAANFTSLLEQLLESAHRVGYVQHLRNQQRLNPLRADPTNDLFDPLKAAVICVRGGNIEEAFWLVFLATHFGKHRRTGWRLARDVYGRLGDGRRWDWASASHSPTQFRDWLSRHVRVLEGGDGVKRCFSNHRKYESLDGRSKNGTGAVVQSYVEWVLKSGGTHQALIDDAMRRAGGNQEQAFDYLYRSMEVRQFGRTGKFDYLTMLGKLQLALIEPGSPYLQGSSGPVKGARLIFGDRNTKVQQLESWAVELGEYLAVDFAMQVLEDALCNWQKSPGQFRAFRG